MCISSQAMENYNILLQLIILTYKLTLLTIMVMTFITFIIQGFFGVEIKGWESFICFLIVIKKF